MILVLQKADEINLIDIFLLERSCMAVIGWDISGIGESD